MKTYSENTSKKRLIWLDLLKGLTMLLIILSHNPVPRIYTRLYEPIYLSVFFFASGFTFSCKKSFGEFFINKLRTLGIPFVCLGIINALLAIVVEHDSWKDRIQFLLSRNAIHDDLWFLACLFSTQFIFYAIVKIARLIIKEENKYNYKQNIFILSLSLVVSILSVVYVKTIDFPLLWQIEIAGINVCFLALGYVLKQFYNSKAVQFVNGKKLIFIGIFVVTYLLSVLIIDNNVNVHLAIYESWIIYFISAIFGIGLMVLLSQAMENILSQNNIITKFIVFIGQNTLVYYAFQSKGIKAVSLVLNKVGVNLGQYLTPIVVAIVVSILLVIPSFIIMRFFPFILGKKLRNKPV